MIQFVYERWGDIVTKLHSLVSMLLLGCICARCSAVDIPVTSVQLKRDGATWKALMKHELHNTQATELEITLPQQLEGGPNFIAIESAVQWSYELKTSAVPVTTFDWKRLATDGTPVRVYQGNTQATGVLAFQDEKLVLVSQSIADGVRYTLIDPKKVTAIDDLASRQASTNKLVLRRVLPAGEPVNGLDVTVHYELPAQPPKFLYDLAVADHTSNATASSLLTTTISCRNDSGVDWPASLPVSVEFAGSFVGFVHSDVPVGVESAHALVSKQVGVHWVWPVLSNGLASAPYLDLVEPKDFVGQPAGLCMVRIPDLEPQAVEATFRQDAAFKLPSPREFAWKVEDKRLDADGTYVVSVQGPWLFRYRQQHAELKVSGDLPTLIPVQFRKAHGPDQQVEWKPGTWLDNSLKGEFSSRPTSMLAPNDIRTLEVRQLNGMKVDQASEDDQARFETWIQLLTSRDALLVEQKRLAQSVNAIALRPQLDTTYTITQQDKQTLEQAAINETALATIMQHMQRLAAPGLIDPTPVLCR